MYRFFFGGKIYRIIFLHPIEKMKLISHRGYGAEGNTRLAFQNARDFGFDVLEVDLHKTGDNEIVLHHDLFLNQYNIEQTDLEVLKNADKHLLSLSDFFQKFPPDQNTIYFDLKGSIELAQLFVDYINTHDICTKEMIVASFNEHHIHILAKSKRLWKIGFITNNVFTQTSFIVPNIDIFIIKWTMLSQETIEQLHKQGKQVFAYTCTTKQIYDYICSFSVDGIVSDIIPKYSM